MDKLDPRYLKIKKETSDSYCQTLVIRPHLRLSVVAFRSLCKNIGTDFNTVLTSADFHEVVEPQSQEDMAKGRGVRPEVAKAVASW